MVVEAAEQGKIARTQRERLSQGEALVSDLRSNLAGIVSPNPFWLASATPTNSGYQVMRAFEAGWGGVVWKTLGTPITNVTSRFAGLNYKQNKMMAMNNIELITDRPLAENLREIRECKKAFPDRAIVASLMEVCEQHAWFELVKKVQEEDIDGFELNFGCPHGMSERGMGAAVGQHPDLIEAVTSWVKEVARVPVIVKFTPNITDVRVLARAATSGGADAVSMINTINSLMGVDIDTWNPSPHVDGKVHTADTAGRRSSRLRSTWLTTARAIPRSAFRSRGSAAWGSGKMPSSSCCWARATCRFARR